MYEDLFSILLPACVTLAVSVWLTERSESRHDFKRGLTVDPNKTRSTRLAEIGKRINEIVRRLERVERRLIR